MDQTINDLSKTNTLIDYACTVGVPHSKIIKYIHEIEKESHAREENFTLQELAKHDIKLEVTSRYPEFNKHNNEFPDDEFCKFCFPYGFEISESSSSLYGCFTLTNDKAVRMYVSYVKIYNDIDTYTKAFKESQNLKQIGPNSLQHEEGLHPILNDAFDITRASTMFETPNSKSILEESKIDKSLLNTMPFKRSSEIVRKGKIYIPMCICFLSRFPYIQTFNKLLSSLIKQYKTFLKFPIEYYIQFYTTQIPAPPKGRCSIKFSSFMPNKEIELYQEPLNKLPFVDIQFSYLTPMQEDFIITIFNSIVLEKQTLFIGKDISQMTNVIEAFLCFLYPFEFQLVCIPYLPKSLFDFLLAPMPFIIGIDYNMVDEAFSRISDQITIVNLEKMQVFYSDSSNPSMEPTQKQLINHNISPLPKHEKEKLCKRVSQQLKIAKVKKVADDPGFKDAIYEIRQAFLLFMVSTLKEYSKYINPNVKNESNIDKYFNKKLFVKESLEYGAFLSQFMDTQMFQTFMDWKVNPQCEEQKLKVTFFDENIIAKQNRYALSDKKRTPFLDDTQTMAKSNKAYAFRLETAEQLELSKIGDYFLTNYNWFSLHKTSHDVFGKGYYYGLFPEFSQCSFPPIKSIAPNLLEETEIMIKESYKPSIPLNAKLEEKSSQDIFIYTTWIEMWIATFWQQDESEKAFRFEQMVDIIMIKMSRKYLDVNQDLYVLIMQTLYKYGTSNMVIKFYEKVIKAKCRFNSIVFALYSKAYCSYKKSITFVKHASKSEPKKEISQMYLFNQLVSGRTPNFAWLFDGSSIDIESHSYKKRANKLKNRTYFLPSEKNKTLWDICRVSCSQACTNCGKMMFDDANSALTARADVRCKHCNRMNTLKIEISLGASTFISEVIF